MSEGYNSGSYGVIAKPSLNNSNGYTHTDKDITKFFFEETDYNKVLPTIPLINNVFDIKIKNYKKTFKWSELPKNVKIAYLGHKKIPVIKGDISKKNENTYENTYKDTKFYAIRMLNGGIPIYMLDDPLYKPKPDVTFLTAFVKQVYKLISQLKVLSDIKYIHGDIREPNILYNTTNNNLYIIDYDFLIPYQQILNTEADVRNAIIMFGYYHFPPETLKLACFHIQKKNPNDYISKCDETINKYINDNINYNVYYKKTSNKEAISKKKIYIESLRELCKKKIKKDNFDEYEKKINKEMEKSFSTFDTYGLSVILLNFIFNVYGNNIKEYPAVLSKLITLFENMYSVDIEKRYNASDALTEITKIINDDELKIDTIDLYQEPDPYNLLTDRQIKQFKLPRRSINTNCSINKYPDNTQLNIFKEYLRNI
jgi:serine/threonine protein kinase